MVCLIWGFVAAFAICRTTSVAAPEAEPGYFIYHGQHQVLILDSDHLAVHNKSSAGQSHLATAISPGLAANGFRLSDVSDQPVSGWTVLDARNALSHARLRAPSTSRAASGAAIHLLGNSLLKSGDGSIDFVSPVFRDNKGGQILLTPRILIGFKPDFSQKE